MAEHAAEYGIWSHCFCNEIVLRCELDEAIGRHRVVIEKLPDVFLNPILYEAFYTNSSILFYLLCQCL